MPKNNPPNQSLDIEEAIFQIEDYVGGNIEGVESVDHMGFTVFLRRTLHHLIQDEVIRAKEVTGETSDGYHTFNELYDYRRVYNAALFNEWSKQGKYEVHKSYKHSDGQLAFGGGWFVAVAELPTGQVTNHYENKHWDDFQLPEKQTANKYDGHSPKQALDRISALREGKE